MSYVMMDKQYYGPDNERTLAAAMAAKGWASGEFATLNQWNRIGRVVTKGEKGTPVVLLVSVQTEGGEEPGQITRHVFNIAQTAPSKWPRQGGMF